jgi:hypothetical protein
MGRWGLVAAFLRDMDAWTWFALIGIALIGIWLMDETEPNNDQQ